MSAPISGSTDKYTNVSQIAWDAAELAANVVQEDTVGAGCKAVEIGEKAGLTLSDGDAMKEVAQSVANTASRVVESVSNGVSAASEHTKEMMKDPKFDPDPGC